MIIPKMDYKSFINKKKKRTLFLFLVITYFSLYFVHVAKYTNNNDVLIYVSRALYNKPILDYAFLSAPTLSLQNLSPSPNYHLAHTVLLWLFYRILPGGLMESIIPAGILSAFLGSLSVGMIFLVCMKMQIDKYPSFFIAIAAGFIPSIFFHSTIGEVYIPGLFAMLLFLYLFLSNRIFYSSLGFLLANLISPVNGLSFSLYFMNSQKKKTLYKGIFIGALAVALYFLTYYSFVKIDTIRGIFDAGHDYMKERNNDLYIFAKNMWHGFLIFFLNIGPFGIFLIRGMKILAEENRSLLKGIGIVLLAYIIRAVVFPVFLADNGCFFLLAFWCLSIPIGIGISKSRQSYKYAVFVFIVMYVFTQIFWLMPKRRLGEDYFNAGVTLQGMELKDVKVMGPWKYAIGVVVGKYGLDLNKINAHYIEYDRPGEKQLWESGEDALIIVEEKGKREEWKRMVYKYLMDKPMKNEILFDKRIKNGGIKKLMETENICIYKWERIKQ